MSQRIFKFFVSQFERLDKPNDPYFKQHYYLLENLVQVQCIALVTDLNDAVPLIIKIFELFYRMVGKNKSIDLDYLMTSILSQLLQEMDVVPPRVVDIIISHFLSKPPESALKDNRSLPVSPGYIVSKTICTDNIDVMTRHVNQYFSDIMSIVHDDESDEELDLKKGGTDKLKFWGKASAQIKAQELAVEIWIAVPELLVNIIGQLEQDLSVDNFNIRELATVSIGKMLGHSPSRVNFVKEHFTTWKAWYGRIKDKNPLIRVSWTRALPDIIKNRTDIIPDICQALVDRLNDPDERVRLVACSLFGELKSSIVAAKLNNKTLFNSLYSRLRDKKTVVRQEAFTVIGSLYESAYSQIEMGNEDYISLFGPIPQKILDQLFLNDKAVNESIDITLNKNIFVVNLDDTSRTIRLLTVINSLNDQGFNAFNAILKRQFTLSTYVGALGTFIREYNGNNDEDPVLKQKIYGTIKWLSDAFAEPAKAEASLQIFAEKASDRACKLLTAVVSAESDYSTVQRLMKDLFAELRAFKVPNLPSVIHTFTILFYRACYSILNRSCITPIVEITRDSSSKLHQTAQSFLKNISASQPTLMKSHVHDLVAAIENGKPGFDGSVDTLKAVNSLAERFIELIPQTNEFFGSLVKLALQGSSEEATEAVKLISFSEEKDIYFNEVIVVATDLSLENPKLPTHLSAIAELYACAPDLIETKHQEIQAFLTQQVLLSNTTEARDTDPEWVDDDKLDSACQSKIFALHVLVNRLKQIVDPEVTKELSKPVFSLLASLIGNMGEIVRPSAGVTPAHYRARLRLESGLLLLHLASSPNIEKVIRPQEIIRMAVLVQDGVLQIRQRFLHTLMQLWSEEKIPRRFVTLIFVAAFEPDHELLHYVSTWIRARVAFEHKNQQNRLPMEKTFSTLLHLLVHHQESFEDVNTDEEGADEDEEEKKKVKEKQTLDFVIKTAAYIVFYLSTVATEENISMIFYISQRIKQYRDNIDEGLSDRLYLVSDIAQFIIIKYQEFKGWSVDTWPGRLQLSADIFMPMPSVEIAQKVAKTTYLPDYAQKDLEEFLRKRFAKLRKQHADLAIRDDDGGKDGKDAEPTKRRRRRSIAKNDDSDDNVVRSNNGSRRSSGKGKKRKTDDDDSDSSTYATGKRRKSTGSELNEDDSSRRRSSRLSTTSKKSLKEPSDVEIDDEESSEEGESEDEESEDSDVEDIEEINHEKDEEEKKQEPEPKRPRGRTRRSTITEEKPAQATRTSRSQPSSAKQTPTKPAKPSQSSTKSTARQTRKHASPVDDDEPIDIDDEDSEMSGAEEEEEKEKENIDTTKRKRGRPAKKASAATARKQTSSQASAKTEKPAPTRSSRRLRGTS